MSREILLLRAALLLSVLSLIFVCVLHAGAFNRSDILRYTAWGKVVDGVNDRTYYVGTTHTSIYYYGYQRDLEVIVKYTDDEDFAECEAAGEIAIFFTFLVSVLNSFIVFVLIERLRKSSADEPAAAAAASASRLRSYGLVTTILAIIFASIAIGHFYTACLNRSSFPGGDIKPAVSTYVGAFLAFLLAISFGLQLQVHHHAELVAIDKEHRGQEEDHIAIVVDCDDDAPPKYTAAELM